MSESTPSPLSPAEASLLFGTLALQMKLLDQDRFVEAFRLWVTRKDASLVDLLREQGWITPGDRAEVERHVQQKLLESAGDIRAVLAGAGDPALRALVRLNDRDLQRALGYLALPAPPTPSPDPLAETLTLPPVQPVPVPVDEIKYQIVSSPSPQRAERAAEESWPRPRPAERGADWLPERRSGGPRGPLRVVSPSWTTGARVVVICLAVLSGLALVGLVVAVVVAVQGQARLQRVQAERLFQEQELERQRERMERALQQAQAQAQALDRERLRVQALQQLVNARAQEAQAQRHQVEAQRQRAEAHFQKALAALERQYTAVRWNRLILPPGKEKEGQQIPQETQEFIRKAVGDAGLTPASRIRLAQTCRRLARLTRETGPMADALELARQGEQVWRGLAGQFPAYRNDLATAQQSLALLYQANGETTKADQALRQALATWGNLMGQYPSAPAYRFSHATALADWCRLYTASHPANTVQVLEQVLGTLGRLIADNPQNAKYPVARARCQTDLARVHLNLGQWAKAEGLLKSARDAQTKLVEKTPASVACLGGLAETYEEWGRLNTSKGSPAQAKEAYEKAVVLRTKAARAAPHEIAPQVALAKSFNLLGLFFHNQENGAAKAKTALDRARAIRKKLAGDFPLVLEYARDLGGSYCNLGLVAHKAEKRQAAVDWYNKGQVCLDKVLKKDPRYPYASLFLRNVHWGRARALTRLGRHADALKDWDRALALDTGPTRNWILIGRAQTLARQGEHRRAVTETNTAVQKVPRSGPLLCDLARVYSLAAAAATKDPKLAEAERKKLAEGYAAKAMEWLNQAQREGVFKNAAVRHKVKKDADLDALRGRADFQKLLVALEDKKAEAK
jgi:tetratricopeptide (TPR) repeat protein